MGFESVYLYREMELLVDTSGPMTLHVFTEMPERDVRERHSFPFNTELTTGERRTVRVRLLGNLKGHLQQLRIDGPSTCVLYGVRVFAKVLGVDSAWQWYDIPLVNTPDGYVPSALPILSTPEGFGAAGLPIVPTPESWERQGLPLRGQQLEASWVEIPVDAIE